MKVILAQHAGFCFGVRRAVGLVEENLALGEGPIYTYGPIIHNESVVGDFERKGVTIMKEGDEPGAYPPGTVIIRSHGVSRAVKESLLASGHRIVDATCPFVEKIHKLVHEHSAAGERVLILGDKTHPEVQGIVGWICGEDYDIINSLEEIEDYTPSDDKKLFLVAQTTFSHQKFQEMVKRLNQKGCDMFVCNTICNATEERQKEAARVAGDVDVMVVIGGKNSSNSQKLYGICRGKCEKTIFVQTAEDLDGHLGLFGQGAVETVGITAGASTPKHIIDEVMRTLGGQ